MKTLVLASEFVSGVNLDVALRTESSFVGATNHRRRSFLTHITLYLHHRIQETKISRSVGSEKELREDERTKRERVFCGEQVGGMSNWL
ncbi:unnamed protein product [Arabidopsis thaliana]|uniref:Uncharacterized protein n=2 Tax=Arabidopsis thaliana TaxID=3702 RepID=A0A654E7H3_ARATH|nr:uncharacterized protein AT1G06045 [Arabidopsis thaliana]ANM60454.1 hypothetical protein AT1G06045 [Arabidopsis thaliana]CAA0170719.1 unnamed protein product [Arabidopsis thaliana]VYS45157.1 unnamed protein product [Arabidopsis thaliana]|eukprot:NP_001322739.1 hypothetical protein AT1G06045 [Arabidopsis thaliana]